MMDNEENINLNDGQEIDSPSEDSTLEPLSEAQEESLQSDDEAPPNDDQDLRESLAEEKPQRPLRLLKKAIEKLFENDQELRRFCEDYFENVARNLKEGDRFDGIAHRIVKHCDTRYETLIFWDGVKVERPNAYGIWYTEWCKSIEYYENRQNGNNSLDTEGDFETDFEPKVEKHHVDDELHPLRDGHIDGVTRWFFEDLSEEEQSLAITVALFEGMQLNNMLEVHSTIGKWLFEQDT